jgi:hypothetical protein
VAELTLEIVEGPRAGLQVAIEGPLTVGRSPDADLVLDDPRVSRRHARVSPAPAGSAVVEDLGSMNGTFVNHNEVTSPTAISPGDEVLVGVTVLELRRQAEIAVRPSAVRAVPPALAAPPPPPPAPVAPPPPATDELEPFLDVNTKQRARLAPLALFALVGIVVLIYLGAR